MEDVFEHLSESLHRELDFRQEAENIARMRDVVAGFSRLRVPTVHGDYSTSRLLVMQDIGGGPASSAPEGPARKEAARQLLESFYKQILVDGFFHADPHPGNLMWQQDEGGGAWLKDIQLGPVLQEMTEIALRHNVALPASMTLTAKALAQMQLAAATLDPDIDPFDVAGKFLMRTMIRGMGAKLDPTSLFYQTQRFKVRFAKVVEAIERLIGARPGQRLEVNFRAASLEVTIRRAGRRLAISLTAGAAILGTALTAVSDRLADWVPVAFGVAAGALTIGLLWDLVRKKG